MKDFTKKVVILNNFSSPYISEAIIVLKDYNPRLESKVIADAEKIVSDYIKKNEHSAQASVHSKKPRLFKILLTFLIAAAVFAAVYYILLSL